MTDQLGESQKPVEQSSTPDATPAQAEGETFDAARAMALIEKLRNQVKELSPKAKQAEQLAAAQKAKEESEMSELQKLNKRLADTESELRQTKRASTAAQIAARLGLPEALANRLQGETPEEMEADAKAILEALPKPTKPNPGVVPNPGAGAAPVNTDAEMLKRIRSSGPDIFSLSAAQKLGGGFINNE